LGLENTEYETEQFPAIVSGLYCGRLSSAWLWSRFVTSVATLF
jgi:hypothetical protein